MSYHSLANQPPHPPAQYGISQYTTDLITANVMHKDKRMGLLVHNTYRPSDIYQFWNSTRAELLRSWQTLGQFWEDINTGNENIVQVETRLSLVILQILLGIAQFQAGKCNLVWKHSFVWSLRTQATIVAFQFN